MSPDPVPSSSAGLRKPPSRSLVSGRREHWRYPITAESHYIVDGSRGQATTANISSGGVFLKSETALPVGKRIEVLIDWPVLLNQRCPIRLVLYGMVLRSDARGTAVGIVRYDFRLRPRNANQFVA